MKQPLPTGGPMRRGPKTESSDPSSPESSSGLAHPALLEQARISRILHDELGQTLTTVGLRLDVLRIDLEARVPEISQHTSEIQRLLAQAMRVVRNLSFKLDPTVIAMTGISCCLDRLAAEYRESFGGVLRLSMDPSVRLRPNQANAMYKIAEQALDNAGRHSGSAEVELSLSSLDGTCKLEVRDFGNGFSTEEVRREIHGTGLPIMEYYAAQNGLQLSVTSTPGDGTIVGAVYLDSNSRNANTWK